MTCAGAIAVLLLALVAARVFGGAVGKWLSETVERISGEHDPY